LFSLTTSSSAPNACVDVCSHTCHQPPLPLHTASMPAFFLACTCVCSCHAPVRVFTHASASAPTPVPSLPPPPVAHNTSPSVSHFCYSIELKGGKGVGSSRLNTPSPPHTLSSIPSPRSEPASLITISSHGHAEENPSGSESARNLDEIAYRPQYGRPLGFIAPDVCRGYHWVLSSQLGFIKVKDSRS
jgi:hypothetical protein